LVPSSISPILISFVYYKVFTVKVLFLPIFNQKGNVITRSIHLFLSKIIDRKKVYEKRKLSILLLKVVGRHAIYHTRKSFS